MDSKRMYLRTLARPQWRAATANISDLALLAGAALLFPLLMLPEAAPAALLRVPLGLALALLAPGYALAAALFPGRGDLDGVARGAASFGLSAVTLPILALIVDALPWGLRPWPMALALVVWIALLCAVAAARRWALAQAPAAVAPAQPRGRAWSGPGRWRYIIGALAVAGVIAAGAAGLMIASSPAQLTEFYMLGAQGLAQDYPRQAAIGEQLAVTIGIANQERDERQYRVEVWAGDPHQPARRALVERAGPLTLTPGQRLEQPISWQMPWVGAGQTVEFLLFMGDTPTPYRRLSLSLDVAAAPATPR